MKQFQQRRFKSAKENNVSCVVNAIKACRVGLCWPQHLKQMPQVQRALRSWFQRFYGNQIEKEQGSDVRTHSPTWSLYGKYLICFTDCITAHNNTRMRCVVSSGGFNFSPVFFFRLFKQNDWPRNDWSLGGNTQQSSCVLGIKLSPKQNLQDDNETISNHLGYCFSMITTV